MTRPYVLHQLLRMGPMRIRDIIRVTGWTTKVARAVLGCLCERGVVLCLPKRGRRTYLSYVALDVVEEACRP